MVVENEKQPVVWPSIVNMWKSLAYSLLNREQKHRVLSVHSGICSIPLAVGILSKLDYGDKGSPALPKDSRVKYNTGDSYILIRCSHPQWTGILPVEGISSGKRG